MLIDWFTVAAQIINFLVLIGLLKFFLYGPVTRAMNQREEKIAARLREAAEKKKEAREELERYRQENAELDRRRQELLSRAEEEAETHKKSLLAEARDAVESTKAKWQQAVEREKESFLRELRERAGRQVVAVTRKTLQDLANADLEDQLTEAFVQKLRHLDGETREALAQSLSSGKGLVVTSAFEIRDGSRARITGILEGYVGDSLSLEYRLDPGVILGVELKTPGSKIAWSVDHHLEALEADLREALEDQSIKGNAA